MLDDGGAVHFQKKILVGLFILPELLGFPLQFRAGADGGRIAPSAAASSNIFTSGELLNGTPSTTIFAPSMFTRSQLRA